MEKEYKDKRPAVRADDYIEPYKLLILGIQHVFTMFGATVLVPLLTGLNVSVALFTAGIGTWFFHLVTKKRMPVFLGSSFAYIAPILLVKEQFGGLEYATGGIMVAGLLYVGLAVIVYFTGPKFIEKLFPPVVTGPIIMVIGLNLAPAAIGNAQQNWFIALVCLAVVIIIDIFAKGFIKLIPVIFALIVGYVVAILMGAVDFTPIIEAKWFALPPFMLPKFNWAAISLIAPVAIVTMVEHIGDVFAVSATVEEDFIKDPGLHKTLIGDGIATSIAAAFGGPANTTYSENTGVLALTRVFKPQVMRIAATFAIALAFIGKLGAAIQTIPPPVIGGISIVLFGMIAAIGVRTVVENRVDFSATRNLLIAAVILVLGIGGAVFKLGANFQLSGMALGAIFGMVLNLILPKEDVPLLSEDQGRFTE